MHAHQVLAYRPGECALCGRGVRTVGPTAQQVDLYVIGSTGTVAICAGLCQECQPSPASLRDQRSPGGACRRLVSRHADALAHAHARFERWLSATRRRPTFVCLRCIGDCLVDSDWPTSIAQRARERFCPSR